MCHLYFSAQDQEDRELGEGESQSVLTIRYIIVEDKTSQ